MNRTNLFYKKDVAINNKRSGGSSETNDSPRFNLQQNQQSTNKNNSAELSNWYGKDFINLVIKRMVIKLKGFILPTKENRFKSQILIDSVKTTQPFLDKRHLADRLKLEITNCKLDCNNKLNYVILKSLKPVEMSNLKLINRAKETKNHYFMKKNVDNNKKQTASLMSFVRKKYFSKYNLKKNQDYVDLCSCFLYNSYTRNNIKVGFTQKRFYNNKIVTNYLNKIVSKERTKESGDTHETNKRSLINRTKINLYENKTIKNYFEVPEEISQKQLEYNIKETANMICERTFNTNKTENTVQLAKVAINSLNDTADKKVQNNLNKKFGTQNTNCFSKKRKFCYETTTYASYHKLLYANNHTSNMNMRRGVYRFYTVNKNRKSKIEENLYFKKPQHEKLKEYTGRQSKSSYLESDDHHTYTFANSQTYGRAYEVVDYLKKKSKTNKKLNINSLNQPENKKTVSEIRKVPLPVVNNTVPDEINHDTETGNFKNASENNTPPRMLLTFFIKIFITI